MITEHTPTILYVCSGNTCRSVIAEAWTKHISERKIHAESAGVRPQAQPDALPAIEALRSRLGIDASAHIPRDVRLLNVASFNYVVTMDNDVARQLISAIGFTPQSLVKWRIDDPYSGDSTEYYSCITAIQRAFGSFRKRFHSSFR